MELPENFTVAIVVVDENHYMIQCDDQMSIETRLDIVKPSRDDLRSAIADESDDWRSTVADGSFDTLIVVPSFTGYLWKASFKHNDEIVFEGYIREYAINSMRIKVDDQHDASIPVYGLVTHDYYRRHKNTDILTAPYAAYSISLNNLLNLDHHKRKVEP